VPSTRAKQPDPRPTLFIDRSLGRIAVPDGLRRRGFDVLTIWDVYGAKADRLDDDVWLRDSGRNDWIALTWDMLRKQEWRDVIAVEQTRVFRWERRMRRPDEKLAVFDTNLKTFLRHTKRQGGWVDVFRDVGIDRYWPR